MAQPTAYQPAHEFLTDEGADPTFPGTELDVEFAAIDLTLTEVLVNLALIQRDDGGLVNGIVTYDSLAPALQTNGIAPATPWATATDYDEGDAVVQGGSVYRATEAHTSGTFSTDLANDLWTLIADLPVGDVDFSAITTATIASSDLLLFGDVSDSDNTKKTTLQSAVDTTILANGTTFPNTGLHILDSDSSHDLIFTPGSNLSSDRTFTLTTGDANRTLDISAANVTISAYMAGLLDDADEATFKASVNLEIGTDVQAYDAQLADIAALTPTDGNIIVGDGANWVAESGATARASLGLTIGTHVQAYDADLTTWAGLTPSANAQSLVTAADYAAMRALLDLEVGTDFLSPAAITAAYQPLDSDLTSIAALSTTAAGRSVLTIADAGADRVVAWDDSAGSMAAIALADITAEGAPASGDYILIYGAEGDLRKVNWSDLPGVGGGINNVVEDTTPQLGGDLDANTFNIGFDDATGIEDDSGNEQLIFQKTTSAVNHVEITNAATGNDPMIGAAGDDTDIDLVLAGKGTGVPKISTNAILHAGNIGSTVQGYDADTAKIDTAQTWSAKQTFGSIIEIEKAIEQWNIVADNLASGDNNFDVLTNAVWYWTTAGDTNATLNFRGDGSNSLDSLLDTGDAITVAAILTHTGTAYYVNALKIDGSSVTPKWVNGTAPSAGSINALDVYTFTILKTASATFTVFAQKVKWDEA